MIRRDSYLALAAQLGALAAVMVGLAWVGNQTPAPKRTNAPVETKPPEIAAPAPKPITGPEPPRIVVDEKAVAEAEAAWEAANRDRDRAKSRETQAIAFLKSEETKASARARGHRSLASLVKDPSARLRAANDRGQALAIERDKLVGELEALSEAPRPRRKILVDKSPVAKKAQGEEFHFEIKADHIAFIDLERLLDRVKTDAKVQLRLTNGMRPAIGTVGPVGAFEMHYEVGRVDDGNIPGKASFGLSAWEITPSRMNRGESFDAAMGPASDFSRAIRRLNPAQDVVTLWIYPDGFPLYRQIRDTLHAQGFLVAARPLPEGMTIRGSPSGSASSAQ